MTLQEKIERLNAYPFYASAALEWFDDARLGIGPASGQEADEIVEKRATGLTEQDLFFIKRLVLYAEHCQEVRIAGVLKGMTQKARDAWIEEKAT